MRKFLYILCFGFLLTTCDDGNIFEVTFDFEDTFSQCGSLVFYKTNQSTSESLSIKLPTLTVESPSTLPVTSTLESILDVGEDNLFEITLPLGNTNVFNYRSYTNLPADNLLFCNDIPPSNLGIITDEVSLSGQVYIRTVLVEDDNDGIPSEQEDLNGNGNYDDDDTDSDGIPNYLDADDDGDNVLTKTELDTLNADGDDDPLTNPKDSDGNGTPDYLDTDDDGDGVLTRDEENSNANLNPTDDISDPDSGVADYLNDQVSTTVVATAFRTHTIRMTYTITATVTNISLPSITQQTLDFGTLDDSDVTSDTRTGMPVFN